jgi:DNA-binding transcriptional regulator YdaS (Cro superfamily)
MSSENPHIARAIALIGSQAALAERIDRSQQAVSSMLAGQPVSGEVAVAIDQATLGRVSRHQLRPDLFPNPLDEVRENGWRIDVIDGQPTDPDSEPGPGFRRVLRIARVEYAAGDRRVFLSDGSELGGLTHCSVTQHASDRPAIVTLSTEIPARKPKEAS